MPWSVKGVRPDARDTAREAARRSGMSVGAWLNSAILDTAQQLDGRDFAPSQRYGGGGESSAITDIHQRLDAIARQIDALTPTPGAPRGDHGVLKQLNDAIARLDRNLAQAGGVPGRSAATPGPAAPLDPMGAAIAEITARQHELEGRAAAPMPARQAPFFAPAHPAPDFSGLEDQLRQITSQIATLNRPNAADEAIAGFRAELAEIRRALHEALPRQAIESLEGEIRALARRIDETRHEGVDTTALSGVERALADIRETLRSLTPAEHLNGIDDTVRHLAGKVDLLLHASQNPQAVAQMEDAIAALRELTAHVASDETLARLGETVHALAGKVEQLAQNAAPSSLFTALEQRITQLTSALETRDAAPAFNTRDLEAAVQALGERIDRLHVDRDGIADFTGLETRIGTLLERLEATDARVDSIGRVEQSLSDTLRRMEEQRSSFMAMPANPAAAMDGGIVNAIQRELEDIRHTQTEADRRTQDSFDIVHNTLGHMVDRLAMIEGDLRDTRVPADPPAPPAPPASMMPAPPAPIMQVAITPTDISFMDPASLRVPGAAATPEPGLSERPIERTVPDIERAASETKFSRPASVPPVPARPAPPAVPPMLGNPVAAFTTPESIAESMAKSMAVPMAELTQAIAASHEAVTADPIAAPLEAAAFAAQETDAPAIETGEVNPPAVPLAAVEITPARPAATVCAPIDPNLPPDHPLEPGTRVDTRPPARPAAERIAASEAALADIPPPPRDARLKTNFIAAARRAAQAANTVTGSDRSALKTSGRVGALAGASANAASLAAPEHSTFSAKLRSLLVGVSVVVIVLGTLRVTLSLFDGHGSILTRSSSTLSAPAPIPAPAGPVADDKAAAPSIQPETPPASENRSQLMPPRDDKAEAAPLPNMGAPADADVTGSVIAPAPAPALTLPVPAPQAALTAPVPAAANSAAPIADKLPDAIGSAVLRTAAMKGDAGAAYEIAFRYAEGKRVPQKYEDALKWYERAAQKGIVPAMFRLGSLYEKGLGVKKDTETARSYYTAAAERGNAKAMHNLAVLYAEGSGRSPDYKAAAQWFRKAAEHGITDSQYNLGVLYARGIGIEQNLTEAFKWFSLAAAQGDADAGRKRDDVAKRLDAQALNGARLAVQTFLPEHQPDAAVDVAAPVGGWDQAAAPRAANAKAPAPKDKAPAARSVR